MNCRATPGIGAGATSIFIALPVLGLIALPVLSLILATTPQDLFAGVRHPLFAQAFWLSISTTTIALIVIVFCGTPLAWWLATGPTGPTRAPELLTRLPIIIPPAVVGIGLLMTFGRNGLLGPILENLEIQVPFSSAAVVLAQIVVASPFYIQSATSAFRQFDPDLIIVARTLGQRPTGAFFRVALPLVAPSLISGASISWARALGEFGATLLFAGSLPGVTQTMPLAIYAALESDLRIALALSLSLAVLGLALFIGLRAVASLWSPRRSKVRTTNIPQHRPRPNPSTEKDIDWKIRISARLGTFKLEVDLSGGKTPIALIGPNGAGKTTLLRLIAGVQQPDSGLIRIGKEILYDSEVAITRTPEQRRIAYVPQGYGLFPHLNVTDNVAFGLHSMRARLPRDQRRNYATSILTEMEAWHLKDRSPSTLSAGEQQRTALARALVVDPLLFLFDEPLSSLDAHARHLMRTYLSTRMNLLSSPLIIVTHDARDIKALKAKVYAIENGQIVQTGSANQITTDPATPFLSEFFAP